MTSFEEIEARIDQLERHPASDPAAVKAVAGELLGLGETILEKWVRARGEQPTSETREGFRLIALHRQGCQGEPSFNACRETCRELVYQYNLITAEPDHPQIGRRLVCAAMVARHLCLFVGGKMETDKLGEFCCSSRPLRANGG